MKAFPVLFLAALVLSPPADARSMRRTDSCDGLTARMIRATGASLAGRDGSLSVFRARDADRMSLECRAPARMTFGAQDREPAGAYFILIGLAAEGLVGAGAEEVETLARVLHHRALVTGMPQAGRAGRAALRCETGSLAAAEPAGIRCVLVSHRPAVLRRRSGLFPGREPV
ncbi:hypothetical protein FPV16_14410 [Methylobacterium sp. W2]|uniref:hypothetical protein n=1 Tax=Methylobacterium sp. W2 TaxID=2598107 RepID=UPI001D0CC866|nr:hypothetical protein [Methylobacterium sp. W2]MCC0807409.1 hypothetical protein [Methylobacterium sp. W2]